MSVGQRVRARNDERMTLAETRTLVLVETAPDTEVLIGSQRVVEALAAHVARRADLLCHRDLVDGSACRADRKEQLARQGPTSRSPLPLAART